MDGQTHHAEGAVAQPFLEEAELADGAEESLGDDLHSNYEIQMEGKPVEDQRRSGSAWLRPSGFFSSFEYAFELLFSTIIPPIRYSPIPTYSRPSSSPRRSFRPRLCCFSSVIR